MLDEEALSEVAAADDEAPLVTEVLTVEAAAEVDAARVDDELLPLATAITRPRDVVTNPVEVPEVTGKAMTV